MGNPRSQTTSFYSPSLGEWDSCMHGQNTYIHAHTFLMIPWKTSSSSLRRDNPNTSTASGYSSVFFGNEEGVRLIQRMGIRIVISIITMFIAATVEERSRSYALHWPTMRLCQAVVWFRRCPACGWSLSLFSRACGGFQCNRADWVLLQAVPWEHEEHCISVSICTTDII